MITLFCFTTLAYGCKSGSDVDSQTEPEAIEEAAAAEAAEEAPPEEGVEPAEEASPPNEVPGGGDGDPHSGEHQGWTNGDDSEERLGGMAVILDEGEYDASVVVSQPGAAVGDLTHCPVSGGVFAVTAEHPTIQHEGGEYYVCCRRCMRRFEEDPAVASGNVVEPAVGTGE
jgi:YHS domain-containing protein